MRPLDLSSRMRLADAVLVVGAVLAAGLLCGSTFADAKNRGDVPVVAPAAGAHGHTGQPRRRDEAPQIS